MKETLWKTKMEEDTVDEKPAGKDVTDGRAIKLPSPWLNTMKTSPAYTRDTSLDRCRGNP